MSSLYYRALAHTCAYNPDVSLYALRIPETLSVGGTEREGEEKTTEDRERERDTHTHTEDSAEDSVAAGEAENRAQKKEVEVERPSEDDKFVTRGATGFVHATAAATRARELAIQGEHALEQYRKEKLQDIASSKWGAPGVFTREVCVRVPPCQIQNPTPYTLRPTPYTLHPAPCTLHPTPYTLHPTPYTLHPTP